MSTLTARWLGRISYEAASNLQETLVTQVRGGAANTLLLLEHDPVVTLGRRADPTHVLLARPQLAARGIERFETGRGGDVTYHGPGQVVGYPVIALPRERRDAHRYLRDLEQAMIRTAADYGITATRKKGWTGIWVGNEKLGAIGVRLNSGWITSHGFAFNVGDDLSGFDAIVPCGISNAGVTSLARLCRSEPTVQEVAFRLATSVADALDLELLPFDIPQPAPTIRSRGTA